MKRIGLLLFFISFSCNEGKLECLTDLVEFTDMKRSPAISVISSHENGGCEYQVALYLCLDKQPIHDEGLMSYQNGKISLKLLSPTSNNFVLFDFKI